VIPIRGASFAQIYTADEVYGEEEDENEQLDAAGNEIGTPGGL